MLEFWNSLSGMEKFYAGCTLFGGVLFAVRMIMMFAGMGDGDLADVDSDIMDTDSSFQLLSLQGLLAFFMMFGLVALAMSRQSGLSHGWALLGGAAAGGITVWLISRVFLGMKRLQSDGTLDMHNAVGQEGTVYLTIHDGGTGKVQVEVQGRLCVLDAISTNDQTIETGTAVKVIRVTGGGVLAVEKI
jgi:membrane protein implicated in regulation of membrane protease activity